MKTLHIEALEAFRQKDYTTAARKWIQGHSLPENTEELNEIYLWVNSQNEISPNADLCAILGLIALDHHEIFTDDREKALIQCIEWSSLGITIDPEHYLCLRHAGSAFYWLSRWEEAAPYYEKAVSLFPLPALQVRLFNIRNKNLPVPDFTQFKIETETTDAMEVYNAGVEINSLLRQFPQMPDSEKERLIQFKRGCYTKAYHLYHKTIVEKQGDPLNNDPHTFAMCCNNLAIEFTDQRNYDEAIAVTTKGMEYSYFMYILQNRFSAYLEGGYLKEALMDGEQLMDDFMNVMDTETYFNIADHLCNGYIEMNDYEAAMDWLNAGLETYHSLEVTDPMISDPEVIRCFTNFHINKAKAEAALGIQPDVAEASDEADKILEEMPDNPSLLINRSNMFLQEGEHTKAFECLQYALHFASEQNKIRSIQVALYNMGYIQVVHFQDETAALESFEQSIAFGNEDFWCYYWAVHCSYHLQENGKTVSYGMLALEVLPQQDNVAEDIIAEIYEHIGTSQIDLGQYGKAAENLTRSLQYNPSKIAEDNLKTAEAESIRNSSGGFFKKLFGK